MIPPPNAAEEEPIVNDGAAATAAVASNDDDDSDAASSSTDSICVTAFIYSLTSMMEAQQKQIEEMKSEAELQHNNLLESRVTMTTQRITSSAAAFRHFCRSINTAPSNSHNSKKKVIHSHLGIR